MSLRTAAWSFALLGILAGSGIAGNVGSSLPANVEIEGLSQTKAKSLGDFAGRAVLLEYFAYW